MDGEAREGKKVFTNQTVVEAGGKEDVSPGGSATSLMA